MKNASAVILAGGRSTRMGFDKQLLKMEELTIVEHQIRELAALFGEVLVASPTPSLYRKKQVRVIGDIHKGIGPLGGIHAALKQARSEAVFVIACDMPYLEKAYMAYMLTKLRGAPAGKKYDACLTQRGAFLEPMHAFYCRSALPVLERELAAGSCSLQRFAEKINSLIISEQEAMPFVGDWRVFINLNTPEDYKRFCAGGDVLGSD